MGKASLFGTFLFFALLQPGLVSGAGTVPFGVIFNPEGRQWEASDQITKRLAEAGVRRTILRLVWKEVEVKKGVYQWERYDRVINDLSRAGLDVMVMITSTPDWAVNPDLGTKEERRGANQRGKRSQEKTKREQTGPGPEGKFTPPPKDPADLVNFASLAAERYKGKVKTWALYNAVQNQAHWIEPGYLARLYEAVRPVLKKADPGAILAMSGLESEGGKREKYLGAFLEAGGGRVVDLYDFHLFAPLSGFENEILGLSQLLKRYGQESKSFQIGSTGDHANFRPTPEWVEKQKNKGWKPWDYYYGQPTTPELQADRLVIRMVWARALGAQGVFWSKLTDRQPTDEEERSAYRERQRGRGKPEWKVESAWGSSSGLLTFDLQPKLAYHALKTLTAKLDGAELLRSLDIGPEGKAYIFRRDGGGSLGVFWTWQEERDLKLKTTAGQIRVADKYGREQGQIVAAEGTYALRVGPAPLYVESEGEVTLQSPVGPSPVGPSPVERSGKRGRKGS